MRCWTISAAASSRSMSGSPVTSGRGAVLGHRLAGRALVGQRPDGQVAIGDHRRGLALAVADHDRADGAVAHQLGDREHVGVGARRDHARGHDLAQVHGRTISGRSTMRRPCRPPPSSARPSPARAPCAGNPSTAGSRCPRRGPRRASASRFRTASASGWSTGARTAAWRSNAAGRSTWPRSGRPSVGPGEVGTSEISLPNRASLQAWIGEVGWAGIDRSPGRLMHTPAACARLAEARRPHARPRAHARDPARAGVDVADDAQRAHLPPELRARGASRQAAARRTRAGGRRSRSMRSSRCWAPRSSCCCRRRWSSAPPSRAGAGSCRRKRAVARRPLTGTALEHPAAHHAAAAELVAEPGGAGGPHRHRSRALALRRPRRGR